MTKDSLPHDEAHSSLIKLSSEGFYDAAEDAREKARIAAQAVKRGVSDGAYKSAYGLSFGVIFAGAFLVELLPVDNAARRGFEDGAEAALDAIRTRHSVSSQTDTSHTAAVPPTPPAEPERPAKTSSVKPKTKPAVKPVRRGRTLATA